MCYLCICVCVCVFVCVFVWVWLGVCGYVCHAVSIVQRQTASVCVWGCVCVCVWRTTCHLTCPVVIVHTHTHLHTHTHTHTHTNTHTHTHTLMTNSSPSFVSSSWRKHISSFSCPLVWGCMCVCVCVCVGVWMCVCGCGFVCVYEGVCVGVCPLWPEAYIKSLSVSINVCRVVYMCVYVCLCVCVCGSDILSLYIILVIFGLSLACREDMPWHILACQLPVYLGLILAEVLGNTILTHSIPTAKTVVFHFFSNFEYFF